MASAPTRERTPATQQPPARDLPEPPPLRKLIGPSVVLVGVGIASGEYVLFPFIASQTGLVFLWAAIVGVLTQFFINMEVERYTLATGETAILLPAAVEAARPRDGRVRDPAQHLARLGDERRDDRDVRVRRHPSSSSGYFERSRRSTESKLYFACAWGMILAGAAILLAGLDQPLVLVVIAASLSVVVMFVYSGLLIWITAASCRSRSGSAACGSWRCSGRSASSACSR